MWNFPLLPEIGSTGALENTLVFWLQTVVVTFFTVFGFALLAALVYRYHRGNKVDRSNPPHHNYTLEYVLMAGMFVVGMVFFLLGAVVFYRLSVPPDNALEVFVVGKQWMWKTEHTGGRSEINELHIPLGQAVKLTMTSQDVIHSFYVPAFRVKQDVLPGRYTNLWFRPSKVGRYHLFCAEYCGTSHSNMIGWVTVMDPSEYEEWLAEGGRGPSMAEQGEQLFVQYHCAGCHRGSQTVRAPHLEGVYGKSVPLQRGNEVYFTMADDRYIRDSILMPKSEVVAGYEPLMPSFQGQINESDLLKIIAYIKSIGNKEATP